MLKTIFIVLLMNVASHAIVESQIQQVMEQKVHQVLDILKTETFSQTQKEKKSIIVMDPVFDYTTMAKISLGKIWGTLSSREQEEFTQAFEKKMKYSYIDKLRLYNNQEVITKALKKVKSTRITLENQIIGKTDTYKVVYLFYKDNKKINGTSMMYI